MEHAIDEESIVDGFTEFMETDEGVALTYFYKTQRNELLFEMSDPHSRVFKFHIDFAFSDIRCE